MGPSEILGFRHAIGRLGPDAKRRVRGLRAGEVGTRKINSCRAAPVRTSLPPALTSFHSPARSLPSREYPPSKPGREDGRRGARDAPQTVAAAQPKASSHSGLQRPETQKRGRGQLLRPDSQARALHQALGVCGRR